MRHVVIAISILSILAVGFLADAIGAPVPVFQYQPTESLRIMKAAFARNDKGAEWGTLSPGFKARLSKRAGRNVDVGDYIAARNQYANDPRVKELAQWMHTAKMTHIKYLGGGRASATIHLGAPILIGKSTQVTMINHHLWQLTVRGERQPYFGFVGDRSAQAIAAPDGSYTVVTRNRAGKVTWQQAFPRSKILRYREFRKWYFDGFGQYETEFMRGIK